MLGRKPITPKATVLEQTLLTEEARIAAILSHSWACAKTCDDFDYNYPLIYSIIGSIVLSGFWPPLFFVCILPLLLWYKVWKDEKNEAKLELQDCRDKLAMIEDRMGHEEYEKIYQKTIGSRKQ